VYKTIEKMSLSDMNDFFDAHVAGKKYTYLVIGKREYTDMKVLKSLGEYQELNFEQLFRY